MSRPGVSVLGFPKSRAASRRTWLPWYESSSDARRISANSALRIVSATASQMAAPMFATPTPGTNRPMASTITISTRSSATWTVNAGRGDRASIRNGRASRFRTASDSAATTSETRPVEGQVRGDRGDDQERHARRDPRQQDAPDKGKARRAPLPVQPRLFAIEAGQVHHVDPVPPAGRRSQGRFAHVRGIASKATITTNSQPRPAANPPMTSLK